MKQRLFVVQGSVCHSRCPAMLVHSPNIVYMHQEHATLGQRTCAKLANARRS